jgi:hypothetical protein
MSDWKDRKFLGEELEWWCCIGGFLLFFFACFGIGMAVMHWSSWSNLGKAIAVAPAFVMAVGIILGFIGALADESSRGSKR